jgi:hypothetical protein
LNSVDLPAPLGPMMATRSPGRTAKLTPRMISVLPKLLAQVPQLNRVGCTGVWDGFMAAIGTALR